jgi:peptidoglycan/LPS O-acetylase OafA/YrhL
MTVQAATQHPRQKFEWVEAARGIAALAVVLMHSANLMNVPHLSGHVGLGGIFNFGYVGVDFFFVLSGFVITYSHQAEIGQPHRIRAYLWRRFTRIYPIYWFSLALAVATVLGGRALLGRAGRIDFGVADLLSTVFLLNIVEPQFVGVAWSLQYEVMFYVLFALAMFNRRAAVLGLAFWFALLLLHGAGFIAGGAAGLLSGYTLEFVMGAGLALWVRHRPPPTRVQLWLWASLAALVAAVLFERLVLPQPHMTAGHVALGAASAALIYALVAIDRARTFKAPRALVALGTVSYSVYLNHITFITLVYKLMQVVGVYARLPEVVAYGVALLTGLGLSYGVGRLVELPLVGWFKNRRLARTGSQRAPQ